MSNKTDTSDPMSWEESIRWLIFLSEVKADGLIKGRPGDLPNLLFDLRRYIQVEPDDDKVEQELARAQANPSFLKPALSKVTELLRCVAERRVFKYPYKGGTLELDSSKLDSDRALAYHDASLCDALIQVAVEDLSDTAAVRVKICANKECAHVFFAQRKSQIYCGNRCSNLIASRNYQAHEDNRKRRAEHARKRYREAVRRK